jgi:hypothetical protein
VPERLCEGNLLAVGCNTNNNNAIHEVRDGRKMQN